MIYCLDTNIISFYLKNRYNVRKRINDEGDTNIFVMCPISYYEVKRGFIRHNSTTKLAEFVDGFIPLCPVGDVDRAMLDRACEIYSDLTKEGRIIEDADILIAAFCIANGYTLVTDNTKHFERIPTLEVANWAEK